MQKSVIKTGVVISVIEDEKKKYVKKTGVLLHKSAKTVELEEATIFFSPKEIEDTLKKFIIPNPQLEIVTVQTQVEKPIESDTEKYEVFALLSKQLNG